MKKGIALFLAFVFVFSTFLSIGNLNSGAAAYTTPQDKSEAQVLQRIDKLVELLEGKYFTTTERNCGDSSCNKCKNANVFDSVWFKNIFGDVSVSQIPGHAYPNGGSGYPLGWSCHGFANFAMWYVFSTTNSDQVKYERVVDDVTFTQSNIEKYAKPGDVIRYQTTYSGHSVMFIEADEEGITVIDSNARVYPDGYCCVRKHKISYNGKAMAISRASNYVASPTLSINYNANGGAITNSEVTGYRYRVESDNGLNLRSGPGTSYGVVGVLLYGKEFEVSKDEIESANGYIWGKTTYGSKTGWIVISKYVSKLGDILTTEHYLEDSIIYKSDTFQPIEDKLIYGKESAEGLLDAEAVGLTREEYYFKGWSTDPQGSNMFEAGTPISPEDIAPELEAGSMSIVLYAVWKSTHEHSFSQWIGVDSSFHTRECQCGEIEKSEHEWSFIHADADGIATYRCEICKNEQNKKIENGLYNIEGVLYYFENGEKVSGFFTHEGIRYYASTVTYEVINYNKWIDEIFYIWNDRVGLEVANGFVDTEGGTVCYENGKQVIGWRHRDGSGPSIVNDIYEQYSTSPNELYYFLSTTGYMVTEESYVLGGFKREFNADHTVKPLNGFQTKKSGLVYYYDNGVCLTGWQDFEGSTYYFMASDDVYGRAATKWMYIGNRIYYFYATTADTPYALKAEGTIGGIEYTYGDDGSILYTGFVNCEYANKINNNSAENIQMKNSTARYYINGEMQTGWQYIDGNYYYFYAEGSAYGSGYMCTESRYIGGVWYEFTSEGICLSK